MRRDRCHCHWLLNPNQEVKLSLHPGVIRFQRLNTGLRRVKSTLCHTKCLTESTLFEKQSLMLLPRYTYLPDSVRWSRGQPLTYGEIPEMSSSSGSYRYLVKWRVYPESENSWEFEIPLRQDCTNALNVLNIVARVILRPNRLLTHSDGSICVAGCRLTSTHLCRHTRRVACAS